MKTNRPNILLMLLSMAIFSSCVLTNEHSIKHWTDLMGKKVKCMAPKGVAEVFFFSPHIVGIWSTDKNFILEYFRTLHIDADGKLYLESLMKGEKLLKTALSAEGAKDNRRIILQIKDGKVLLVVANGLNEQNQMLNPSEMECEANGEIKNYFQPKQIE